LRSFKGEFLVVWRRFLGFLVIVAALVGIGLSIAGAVLSWRGLDLAGRHLDGTFVTVQTHLDTITDTLILMGDTVNEALTGLETVEATLRQAATALDATAPLIVEAGAMAENVAGSIEGFNATIPTLVTLSESIDTLLRGLARLRLGTYNPEKPLPAAIQEIGDNFAPVPDQLRHFGEGVVVVETNVDAIGTNLEGIAGNLEAVTAALAGLPGLIDGFVKNMEVIEAQVTGLRAQVAAAIGFLRIGAVVLFVWLGLSQLLPLYLGFRLLADRPTLLP
jgi:ABC-type transporter Mla subunit MlaD